MGALLLAVVVARDHQGGVAHLEQERVHGIERAERVERMLVVDLARLEAPPVAGPLQHLRQPKGLLVVVLQHLDVEGGHLVVLRRLESVDRGHRRRNGDLEKRHRLLARQLDVARKRDVVVVDARSRGAGVPPEVLDGDLAVRLRRLRDHGRDQVGRVHEPAHRPDHRPEEDAGARDAEQAGRGERRAVDRLPAGGVPAAVDGLAVGVCLVTRDRVHELEELGPLEDQLAVRERAAADVALVEARDLAHVHLERDGDASAGRAGLVDELEHVRHQRHGDVGRAIVAAHLHELDLHAAVQLGRDLHRTVVVPSLHRARTALRRVRRLRLVVVQSLLGVFHRASHAARVRP